MITLNIAGRATMRDLIRENYRWWTVRMWSEDLESGVKLGPVTFSWSDDFFSVSFMCNRSYTKWLTN